jgi:hypothetical protein
VTFSPRLCASSIDATDFVAGKQPDACPGQARGRQTIAARDEQGDPFKALVKKLMDRKVALTTTLTVFETFTRGRSIGALNGAKYLGRDATVGSIAAGKQADLVVVLGDPSTTIADVERIDTVFKKGIGFDSAKLIASVTGQAGIW